jgi:predicted nucleotide-binding protein
VVYTPAEVRALTPVRQSVETRASLPDLRDVFLCHAWDDRQVAAKELHDLLESAGVSVWFSEKDVALGTPLLREIDRGLAKSRVGIVLVTPALLHRLQAEGIADKELSALLARA